MCGTQMSSVVENKETDPNSSGESPDLLTSGLRRISEPRAALVHSAFVHETIPMAECTEPVRAAWERMRKANACYRSPFFSYDFIEAVSQVCPQVELAVARYDQKILAILPFVRKRRLDASPVGAGVNDAHGLLADSEYPFSFVQFLNKCGLRSFAFHAAPPDSPGIERYEMGRGRSFLADLTVDPQGYEHYLRKTSSTIDRQGQKSRRLAREVGPLRLEYDCKREDLIDYLIRLKGLQYQRTHTFDILAVEWIRKLLLKLHSYEEPRIRGLLSVLFAGEHPVALHYGMLDGDLLHYWFPVYDERYAYGSPGTQMFLDIAKEAAARGVRAIDMGYSEQAYKYKLTNVITEMSYGLVDPSPWRRHLHRRRLNLRQQLKGLWFKDAIKPIVRRIMPNLGGNRYQQ